MSPAPGVELLLLAVVRPQRNDSGAKISTEKLWEVLRSFIEQYRLVLGDKPTSALANGAHHIVGKTREVLVHQKQIEADIEHRLNVFGVQAFGSRQGVAGCGYRLSSDKPLLPRS